jgi:glyoxylase-like metal-dependent hydrolase (beta-lactamase superfamily II)
MAGVSASEKGRGEVGRGERTLPGVWRLRLPLPWPGVPHCNAWAVAADDGIVLFDTGYAGDDGTRQLEFALAQVGFELADIRLLVCTHSHSDHYGLAGPIVDAAGCELWMHPAWGHIRSIAEDPDVALERRIEVARQSGVPPRALERYRKARRGGGTGVARLIGPDRELVPGVAVRTDLGPWHVYETPGHAPSHVVLHQPDQQLLISGDHLLGRVSLFFDYGHTPDPVAEFAASLNRVEGLDVGLVLAGHGRPFRGLRGKVRANRAEMEAQLGRMREALAGGVPRTAFETLPDLIGAENVNEATAGWGLQLALAYLDHLVLAGEAEEIDDADPATPRRWRATA